MLPQLRLPGAWKVLEALASSGACLDTRLRTGPGEHTVGPQTTWAEWNGTEEDVEPDGDPGDGAGCVARVSPPGRAQAAASAPFSGPACPALPGTFNYRAAEKNPPCI